MKQFLPVSRRCFTWNNFVICSMPLFHMKQKCHPFGWHLSLSIKSVFTPKQQSRGSAHSKAFAAQTHENRGRVPRFSYFKREKVSVWELSDVRVLRSQNTSCRKNVSFSTDKAKVPPKFRKDSGACGRTRTGDLRITNALLYQLSHASMLYSEKWPSRSQLFQYSMVLKIRQDFFENFS